MQLQWSGRIYTLTAVSGLIRVGSIFLNYSVSVDSSQIVFIGKQVLSDISE